MTPLDLMPPRDAWPKHPRRVVQIPHPLRKGRTLRCVLAPWSWRWGFRHMLARVLTPYTPNAETLHVARLWINGAGADHEIRFAALPPRPYGAFYDRRADQGPFDWAPTQEPIHGADNSYMHVPGLKLSSGSRVCPRGITYFKTSDVLEVMAWMDGLLDQWYPEVKA